MTHASRSVVSVFGMLLLGCVVFGLNGCSRAGSEHYTNARELERKLLMRSQDLNYADQGYFNVAKELHQVPPWSSDYGPAQEKLKLIQDARRLKANEVFQLDYLPKRLEGVALASLAPEQIDVRPLRMTSDSAVPGASSETSEEKSAAPGPGTGDETTAASEPVREAGTDASGEPPAGAEPAAAAKAGKKKAAEVKPVIMYSTSWCGFCRRARAYFNQRQIAFVDKDIERDEAAAQELVRKVGAYSGVPVIDIDGTIIRGFDQRGIEMALARRKN